MPGTVGVEIEQVRILHLPRLVLGDKLVGDARGRGTVGVAERQVEPLEQREAPAGVGQTAHADIRDAVYDALVALLGLGERAAGIDIDPDAPPAAPLDLACPLRTRNSLHVGRREEDAVVEADGPGRGLAVSRASGGAVATGRATGQQGCQKRQTKQGRPCQATGFKERVHEGKL